MGSNFSPFGLQDLWDNLCILTTLAHAISGIESQFPVSMCFLFVSFVSRKIASSLRQTIWMLIICYKIRTTTVSSLGAALGLFCAIFSFYFSLAKHNIRASYTPQASTNKQDKQVSFLEKTWHCVESEGESLSYRCMCSFLLEDLSKRKTH